MAIQELELEAQRALTRRIREMDRVFWLCRSDGHHWEHNRSQRADYDRDIVERTLVCRHCKGQRLDTVNMRSGVVAARRYRPSEGYRLTGYGRRPSAEFRAPLVVAELKGTV